MTSLAMTFLTPWFLLGLLPVAAVALWTLLRPGRQVAIVPTLTLWQKAIDALPRTFQRRTHRATLWWALLLAGATAAVLAMARPTLDAAPMARHVAVVVYPSAELAAGDGPRELRRAVGDLLARLAPRDTVRIILPGEAGESLPTAPRDEAMAMLDRIVPLPVSTDRLTFSPVGDQYDHVYRVAPAGLGLGGGSRVSVIELPASLPAVTVDAFAAEPVGEQAQAFVAVRNHTAAPLTVQVEVGEPGGAVKARTPTVPPGGRSQFTESLAAVPVLLATVKADGNATDSAVLVRAASARRKVFQIGRDDPLLRRYIQVDRTLQVVADAKDADLVIANAADPPPGKPALVIHPPGPPSGWRDGNARANIALADARVAAGDPMLRGVSFAGVAVRGVTPWVQSGGEQRPLVSLDDEAIVLAEGAPAAGGPRRVYVAFDISVQNTNWGLDESFVIFMRNAVDWLCPPVGRGDYGCLTPTQAGPRPQWALVAPAGFAARPPAAASLPCWPGLYKDSAGQSHAVSLTGLATSRPAQSVAQAIAVVPLPPPSRQSQGVELWRLLAVFAMGCWLAGWTLRLR